MYVTYQHLIHDISLKYTTVTPGMRHTLTNKCHSLHCLSVLTYKPLRAICVQACRSTIKKGLQAITHVSIYTLTILLAMGPRGQEIAYNLLHINIFIIQLFTTVD